MIGPGTERILLVDADSTIPNIALMKLKAHYRQAELIKCNISYYPGRGSDNVTVDASGYDKVFVSGIFFATPDKLTVTGCSDIEYGGSAYDIKKVLPSHIANLKSDYSIYPEAETSYGFLTRGCFRNCKFCIVRQKEGDIHLGESLDNIVQHDYTKFLDNNFLCHPQAEDMLQELIDRNIRCQFNQGLDIRIMTDSKAKLLSKVNCHEYIFAFDRLGDERLVTEKYNLFKKYVDSINHYDSTFFIYCHPDMDICHDVLHRIRWCRENWALPYLMLDIACWDSPDRDFYLDLKSWTNWRQNWITFSFEQFLKEKNRGDKLRTRRSIATYNEGRQDPEKWQNEMSLQAARLVDKAETISSSDFEDLLL